MIGVEGELRVPVARDVGHAVLLGVSLAALLLAAGLTALISWNRNFQVDEVEHIHSAYEMAEGRRIYADFWEGHNPLLYTVLSPLVDAEQPVVTFRRARGLMLAILACSIALAAFAATRLGASPAAGALAAGLLLLNSTFVERGIEVRPDGALALCVLGALAAGLLRRPTLQRSLVQALLLSAAFLFTQKAVFQCVAFGCLWVWQAVRERRASLVLLPVALWLVPVAATVIWLVRIDAFSAYLQYNVMSQVRIAAGVAFREQTFGPAAFLWQEGMRNLLFMLLAMASLGYAAIGVARRRPRMDELAFPTFLCAVGLAYLWASPGPYPYLHVAVIPVFAVLGASTFVRLARCSPARSTRMGVAGTVALALVLTGLTSLPRLAAKARVGNLAQLALLEETQRITSPDDRVFDLVGLYLRPNGYPIFTMPFLMIARYKAGGFPPIVPALDANQTVAVLANYRIFALPEADLAFLSAHFVQYVGNLFVLGTQVDGLAAGEERRFRVLKTKPFRFEGKGTLLVDGMPFTQGELARGEHVLSSETGVGIGRLRLDTPDPQPGPPGPPIPLYVSFD